MTETTAMETMWKSLAGSLSLQGALNSIRNFNGHNMPLKDFIQDIRNGKLYVTDDQEKQYVSAILGRLEGSARDCTYGEEFTTVDVLIKHLKNRFAPGKDYSYYIDKINNIRMKQDDTVGSFYDKLKILISGASSALKEELKLTEEALKTMMRPLTKISIDAFIKGLPADMAKAVDLSKPDTLEKAYAEATRLEIRMNAKIIPDTRYRNNYRTHENWERDEYSSASYRNYEPRSYNNYNNQRSQFYDSQPRQTNQGERYNYNQQQGYRQTNMPQVKRQEYQPRNVNYVQSNPNDYEQDKYNNSNLSDNYNRNQSTNRYASNALQLFNHRTG